MIKQGLTPNRKSIIFNHLNRLKILQVMYVLEIFCAVSSLSIFSSSIRRKNSTGYIMLMFILQYSCSIASLLTKCQVKPYITTSIIMQLSLLSLRCISSTLHQWLNKDRNRSYINHFHWNESMRSQAKHVSFWNFCFCLFI